jgi:hypothetical protein
MQEGQNDSDSKYLYIIKWWQPFPVSEYGGLIILIAANDAECKLLLETRFPKQAKQHAGAFAAALLDARKMELAEPTLGTETESGIIEEFIT